MSNADLLQRIAELEQRISELERRPAQQRHHYHYNYSQPAYVPQPITVPTYPPWPYEVTCKAST